MLRSISCNENEALTLGAKFDLNADSGSIDLTSTIEVPSASRKIVKQGSLLKNAGDKEKRKKGTLKVGFSIEDPPVVV